MSQTLLKALTNATGLPRRRAFSAIREGRLSLDGISVLDPSAVYRGGTLAFDGRPLAAQPHALEYLMLNKPAGIISSAADELGRTNVLDLVPGDLKAPGLHPVGRLDRDTTGLLLLTNDGDLTYRLTHPRHEVEKEYWLSATPPLDEAQIESLRAGVEVDGSLLRPVSLRRLPQTERLHFSVVISEGRNRQIRRMVEAVGGRVRRLHRVREGPLRLGSLPEGRVRRLTEPEVLSLQAAAGARSSTRSG